MKIEDARFLAIAKANEAALRQLVEEFAVLAVENARLVAELAALKPAAGEAPKA